MILLNYLLLKCVINNGVLVGMEFRMKYFVLFVCYLGNYTHWKVHDKALSVVYQKAPVICLRQMN